MNKLKIYLPSVLIPLLSGGIVGILISGSMDYDKLNQPALAPPSILFPIVWTILYILMGISYGILKENGKTDDTVKIFYYTQLIVNLLWPIAFFVLKWRLFAFFWILLLDFLVIYMTYQFFKRVPLAGYLQIPYILWILFASYLNIAVYYLN